MSRFRRALAAGVALITAALASEYGGGTKDNAMALLKSHDASEAEAAPPPSATALALHPGMRVQDYVLQARVRSLPSTFAPSAVLHATAASADLDLVGHAPAASWLVPEIWLRNASGEEANETTGLALPEPESAPTSPLGLPSPFEAELALASASSTFRLHRRVQRGAHGEVWRAVRADDPLATPLVLKRMTLERGGAATLRSGLRERHFGRTFRMTSGRIARYLDTFEERGSLWLVFRDEGVSLHDLIYTRVGDNEGEVGGGGSAGGGASSSSSFVTLRPSHAWLQLRQQPGHCTLRHIIRQSMEGVAALHKRSVTHRDLKPGNVIIQAAREAEEGDGDDDADDGRSGSLRRSLPSVRLADFGSAVDAEVLQPHVGLYPESGPSVAEETEGYQPPEASLGGDAFDTRHPPSYDLWSMGVLLLELLLGTPQVLTLSSRAEASLRIRFGDQPEAVLRRLLLANALAEHCILPPAHAEQHSSRSSSSAAAAEAGPVETAAAVAAAVAAEEANGKVEGVEGTSSAHGAQHRALPGLGGAPPAARCGKETFLTAIARSDSFAKYGLPLDGELLDLAWRLLKWEPSERLSAEEALNHPALVAPREEAEVPGSASWWSHFRHHFRHLIDAPSADATAMPHREAESSAAGGSSSSASEAREVCG